MNLLKHMMYSHDSKIRPELITAMGDQVQPSVNEFENGFYGPYHRATLEQRALYKPTLDRINAEFETQWPKMTDQQKMRWKYQRYMQDYLATISSIDDNLGRVLNYLDQSGLSENTIVIYTSDKAFISENTDGLTNVSFMMNPSKPLLLFDGQEKSKANKL